jgi:Immunity protein 53
MTEDLLPRLSRWFASHCDGEREHHYGILIQTTDNPGWWVKIALDGTELSGRSFATVSENIDTKGFPDGERWLHCCIENGQWHGAGDETRLAEIIATFLAWAEPASECYLPLN